jgi:hypothetical protein
MSFRGRETLPEPAQTALSACDSLRCANGNEDGSGVFNALLQYRGAIRALHDTCIQLDQESRVLQENLSECRLQLWSVNQKHNAILSEIEHLSKRHFSFLSLDIDITRKIGEGGLELLQKVDVLASFEQEELQRHRLNGELERKKKDLEDAKQRLEEQRSERRKLQALLSSFLTSPTASALLDELKKHASSGSEKVAISLKEIFDSLCNLQMENLPWDQLRLFTNREADLRKEEEEENLALKDALYNASIPTDQIRIKLNESVKLTIFCADNQSIQIRMDPIEFKMNEEEAEVWLRTCVSAPPTTPSHVLDVVRRLKTVWEMDEELSEECSTSEGLFSNLTRLKAPHTFSFNVQSGALSALATLCTAPNLFWKLDTESMDEAFATRCRLVQDRLNTLEMLSSPIALQLAFLRKLVQ